MKATWNGKISCSVTRPRWEKQYFYYTVPMVIVFKAHLAAIRGNQGVSSSE